MLSEWERGHGLFCLADKNAKILSDPEGRLDLAYV